MDRVRNEEERMRAGIERELASRAVHPCGLGGGIRITVPAYCTLGLLACSEAYEFGQLDTGLSWFR